MLLKPRRHIERVAEIRDLAVRITAFADHHGASMECCPELRNPRFRQLFFKWIKQHLRIKRFYGTSENAVRTQIWIAISVYVLVAIIKKKLRLNVSLHTLLQILSLTLFEKLPLKQAVAGVEPIETPAMVVTVVI